MMRVLLFVLLLATVTHSFRAPRINHGGYRNNQLTIQMSNGNSITKHITKIITSGLVASSFFSVPMLVVSSSPQMAMAGFFQSNEQDAVDIISKYQKPVFELLDALRPADIPNAVGVYASTQVLKGSKEDADVVTTYLYTYISPMQKKMEEVAKNLKLPQESDQTRVEILPALMKGHTLELQQAIKEQKFDEMAKEVEEVQETLAEFLKLSSTAYTVTPFVATRPLSDSELFGPLGCEFWGKKRVPGSNACASPDTIAPEQSSS